MFNIAFRADGGSSIGMGHIMRCLSLAKEFRRAGCHVYFLSKYEEGINRIKEKGFDVIKLINGDKKNNNGFYYGDVLELEKETGEVIAAVKEYAIDLLLIDAYNVTEEYFLKIKSNVKKLGYIDDVNKFIYPVDILINGNITGEYLNYKKYCEEEMMLLGPKYNPIREEFKNLPERVVNKEVREIMVTTGGSDPYDMSVNIVNMLMEDDEVRNLKINVVIGNSFKNKEQLRDINKKNENVVLFEDVELISRIMLRSDIAISSGGSTLYELCACGTPVLAFIMADNQELIVKKMDELGYIKSLGWYDKLSRTDLEESLKSLCRNCEERAARSRKMQQLVDGFGVQRVVKQVLEYLQVKHDSGAKSHVPIKSQ